MKTVILNGFGKKSWTTKEVAEILSDCGFATFIDDKFVFKGTHHIIKKGGVSKPKKKKKK